jgi:hypothetical protein
LNRLSLVYSTLGASFEEDLADEIEDTLYYSLVEYLSVLGDCAVTFYQREFKSSWKSKSSKRKDEKPGSVVDSLRTQTINYARETPKLLEMNFMRRSVC